MKYNVNKIFNKKYFLLKKEIDTTNQISVCLQIFSINLY